jgi:hypothetical protein
MQETNNIQNNNDILYKNIKTDLNKQYSCLDKLFNNHINYNLEKIIKLICNLDDLNESSKVLLLIRYMAILNKIQNKYKIYSKLYSLSVIFAGVTSIIITTLLSINNAHKNLGDIAPIVISWITLGLSVILSFINLISTFYKWDRKYILMFKIFYKLEREIWLYLELVGPYKINEKQYTHQMYFSDICARLEYIYKKVNDNLLDIEENDQDNNKTNIGNRRNSDIKEELMLQKNNSQRRISLDTNYFTNIKKNNTLETYKFNNSNINLKKTEPVHEKEPLNETVINIQPTLNNIDENNEPINNKIKDNLYSSDSSDSNNDDNKNIMKNAIDLIK